MLFSSTWEEFHTRGRYSVHIIILIMVFPLLATESVCILFLSGLISLAVVMSNESMLKSFAS